jgi:hypothetical protein
LSLPDDVFDESSCNIDVEIVAGGGETSSIIQPLFHPLTGQLYYISDQTGYYNIFLDGHPDHPIVPMDADFGGKSKQLVVARMMYMYVFVWLI